MANYKTYKPELRKNFNYSCGYCQTREPEIGGSKNSFQIDHYKPKSKFPDLINNYENLIYACRACNGYKSDYWPSSIWDNLLKKIILNPRVEDFEKHIDKSNFAWYGITFRGKWNISTLRLASETQISIRKDRARIEKLISKFEKQTLIFQTKIHVEQNNGDLGKVKELKTELKEHMKDIEMLRGKIQGPKD
ncbi:NinG family protein [Legionella qingyii]|uniref:NinG family protein n=1 Tax=Legionella qingyii TaxID=2184757 RepID=A0A317TXN5_9GAMM|nr:HNH endonuclease [Legionella qingyii]PWY54324.1 NinG family protein [Legionella qingyii]RUR24132.1 NinG family protein [Legionella qingyii]